MSKYSFNETFRNVPRFILPRVRIFLSVDLVGSSKLKQAGPDRIQNIGTNKTVEVPHDIWLPELSNFYGAFPKFFAEEWARGSSIFSDKFQQFVGYEPSLWKTNGDEIIFVKHVKNRSEISFFISCWLKAVARYKTESKTKLDVKSTAWCAGFPLNNSEVILDTSSGQIRSAYKEEWKLNNYQLLDDWYEHRYRNDLLRDYIGPSIDIGFRLCEFSRPNVLPISVELAWFLSNQSLEEYAQRDRKKIEKYLEFPSIRFLGELSLKGVFGGHPYPVFFLDMDQNVELRDARDRLIGRQNGLEELIRVREYCQYFFETYSTHFPKPFIAQENGKFLAEPTKRYINSIKRLAKRFKQEKQRYPFDGSGSENRVETENSNDLEKSTNATNTIMSNLNKNDGKHKS